MNRQDLHAATEMQGTRKRELATMVILGAMGLFLAAVALLSLRREVIVGAAVVLALPAALYAAWVVRFATRWPRHE
jgi:hypothetical protein